MSRDAVIFSLGYGRTVHGRGLARTGEAGSFRMPESRSGVWEAAVQFVLPFILVVFVGLEAGGYDIGIRSQVGIIVIWLALLGVALGLLPVARVGGFPRECLCVYVYFIAPVAEGAAAADVGVAAGPEQGQEGL